MSNVQKILTGVLSIIVVLVAVVVYNVLKTPAEASQPVRAIPLAIPTVVADAVLTAEATTVALPGATVGTPQGAGLVVGQIVQSQSEARFIIDEVLNNNPNTVIGKTNQVAGEIAVDPQDPSKTRVGVIQVDARTLQTDNDFRNRAIKNQILQTDQYEYVTFTPVEITGLPSKGEIGKAYTFQIAGDLKIRDVTKRVTFDVTATAVSATQLKGTAKTTIQYADYGISIPRFRQLASVADTVRLEIDFVAAAK